MAAREIRRVLIEGDGHDRRKRGCGVGQQRARCGPAGKQRGVDAGLRQLGTNRRTEPVVELVDRVATAGRVGRRRREVPILLDMKAPSVDDEPLRRFKLADAAVRRERRRHVPERQVRVDCGRAAFAPDTGILEQRPDLRGEHDPVAVQQRKEEGAHACLVAREEQPSRPAVPHGARKGAAQPLHRLVAPFLIGVSDDFGVGAVAEGVPEPLEVRPEPPGVRERRVGDDADRAVRTPSREVVGCFPVGPIRPAAEGNPRRDEHGAPPGSTSRGIEHLLQRRPCERLALLETDFSDETAHAASVEQAGCHEFDQKERFQALKWAEKLFLQAHGGVNG
jgi:hypothetical protein